MVVSHHQFWQFYSAAKNREETEGRPSSTWSSATPLSFVSHLSVCISSENGISPWKEKNYGGHLQLGMGLIRTPGKTVQCTFICGKTWRTTPIGYGGWYGSWFISQKHISFKFHLENIRSSATIRADNSILTVSVLSMNKIVKMEAVRQRKNGVEASGKQSYSKAVNRRREYRTLHGQT